MGLTVTNSNTLQLLNIVNRTSNAQSNVLTQLSTGFRINRAADDPAGLIAADNLSAEITAVNAALANNQRSDAMLATAEGGLVEVTSLLQEIETLVIASTNDAALSAGEIAANQAQIDDALAAIDRIASTTTFNGKRLLNGEQSIRASGIAANTVEGLQIFSRGSLSTDLSVTATVKTAAASAKGTITMVNGATLKEDTEVVINGSLGSATILLATGDDRTAIANKIAAASSLTGVTAAVSGASVDITSVSPGSDEFVSLDLLSGGTFTAGGPVTDIARTDGTDAVVTVNGSTVTADGTDVSYSVNGFSFSFSLGTSLDAVNDTETFTILADGGLTFQLGTDTFSKTTLGIDSIASHKLGGGSAGAVVASLRSGGPADLASKSPNSLKAVRRALEQVATLRGRLGGFQRFQVQTSINSLTQAAESLTQAKGQIVDTDFAQATAELNRQSVLLNSGISLLGLANQQASQLLALLG